LAWRADAIVDVDVAFLAGETGRTDTFVAINHVGTDATVDARAGSALVDVNFAMDTRVAYRK
jgi:hypothetical protein